MNNNIITWDPVDWGSDSVLVTKLEGVQHSQNLSSVSTSGSRVRDDETNGLLWVNDEDGTDGELDTLVINVGSILVVNHVVSSSNLSLWVSDNWEGKLRTSDLINVLDPGLVGGRVVSRKTNQLGTSLLKLWLQLSKGTKLSSTDWSEVIWVGEENSPAVTSVLVEVNWAVRGVGLEVWSLGTKTKCVTSWLWNGHYVELIGGCVVESLRNMWVSKEGIQNGHKLSFI